MAYRNPKTNTVEVYSDDTTCILRRPCTLADQDLPDIATLHMRQQKQKASALRYKKEIQGVDTPHGRISTDRESQMMLANTIAFVTAQPQDVVWKKEDGTFVTLTHADLANVAGIVLHHVESCFRQEAAVVESLLAAEDVTKVDVEAHFNQ